MRLNEIRDNEGARRPRTRVARGPGSGKGTTGGRGQKGQKSRSGVSLLGFEGGQMPLYRRTPKRGFKNLFGRTYAEVNVGRLQKAVDAKKLDTKGTVDAAAMQAAGVITNVHDGVKLLGKGELSAKLTLEVALASKGAVAAVEKAGGSVAVTDEPKRKRDRSRQMKKRDAQPEPAREAAPAADSKADDVTSAEEEAKQPAADDGEE